MNNIDDLIFDIYIDEALPVDGDMKVPRQKRIEATVLNAIEQQKEKTQPEIRKKKFNKRKWFVVSLAAALLIAFGITAGAAMQNDWDMAIVDFMGIDRFQTSDIEVDQVEIGEKSVCNGIDYSEDSSGRYKDVTMTAASSVGDNNSVYIRVDTDYKIPEGFDVTKNYILPENFHFKVTNKKDIEKMRGSTFTSIVEDGKLVFMIYILDCEDINKSSVHIDMENLYLYHDLGNPECEIEEELIYEGNWALDWKYDYRSKNKNKFCLKILDNGQSKLLLTKVDISALSVSLKGVKNPSEKSREHDDFRLTQIKYKDGTTLDVKSSSAGGNANNFWIHEYYDLTSFEKPLDVDDIYSITFEDGTEIIL